MVRAGVAERGGGEKGGWSTIADETPSRMVRGGGSVDLVLSATPEKVTAGRLNVAVVLLVTVVRAPGS
jgi:hypothetical protein